LRETCGIGGSKSSLQIEKEIEQEERKVLMERSRARTKNWPNTIENMRNKRIEDRYRQLEEAELARRRIDEEEDAFNQEKRRQVLEHAAKKAHDA
jgi:hypothetical protein